MCWKGFDWGDLAQDGERWRAVVKPVMNQWSVKGCEFFE